MRHSFFYVDFTRSFHPLGIVLRKQILYPIQSRRSACRHGRWVPKLDAKFTPLSLSLPAVLQNSQTSTTKLSLSSSLSTTKTTNNTPLSPISSR